METLLVAEVLGAENFKNFLAVVRHYCLLIENKQPVVPEEFIKLMQRALLDLYSAALHQPRCI